MAEDTRQLLATAVAAAEDKKAEDLRVLALDPAESGLADYFLVMSGSNPRQIQTLADEIELQIKKKFGEMPHSREGYKQAEWVLLDYVDFVVHIFSRERREYYALERLRKTATPVGTEDLKSALEKKTAKSREAAATPARKSARRKTEAPVKAALAKKKPAPQKAAKKPAAKKTPVKKSSAKKKSK